MGYEGTPIERVYCCGRDDNDALIAALASRRDDPYAMAAMMNGNNNWNNPFIYLVWMMMAQRMGWGNEWNNQSGQIEALRTQMQDNQNSNMIMDAVKGISCDIKALANQLGCDFNALSGAICDVRNGISKLSGEIGFSAERVINAVNLGNCNLLSALKDCCCETQKEILAQSNLLQRGQDFINRSIERGFSAQGFQAQQDKCEILRAGENNTQRIIDTLNTHWKDEQVREIQDLKFQLSQKEQNEFLLNRMKNFFNNNGYGCGGCNNGCGGF